MSGMNRALSFSVFGSLLGVCVSTQAALADLPIATVGPMTGPYASIGEQMRKGAEMAVRNINAAGGVLGEKLKLDVMDDVCDPKQATAVANQLANRQAHFVAGHFCSSATIPASEIYNEEGIIMMSPASTAPVLTERGLDSVFRVCGRDDQQGKIAAEYILKHYQQPVIAVIHDKTSYGKGLADETLKALRAQGVDAALYEAITPGERDFSALVTRMKHLKVNLIYLGGYHTEAGLIKRQAREQGLDAPLISGDALITREYWDITGASGEGTFMTFSPDPRLSANARPVVAAFRAEGYEPEGYTLYNYAAVQIFAQAAAKAGTLESEAVIRALRSTTFDTVLGPISFDAKGDVTAPGYVMYRWTKGDYTYAEPMK
jgi:branched-chain amino acid transport system substrate-binding protein